MLLCIQTLLFAFQDDMRQLRQDMVHLEEQALHEEHHVLELIDIKKKLLRTEVSGTLLFNLHAFGSIIDHKWPFMQPHCVQ